MFFCRFLKKMQNAPYFWLKKRKKIPDFCGFYGVFGCKRVFFDAFVVWGREEVLIKCFGFVVYRFVFTVVV